MPASDTYERIDIAWRDVLKKAALYDRQPYTELEKVLRSVGKEDEANEVYLEGRGAERRDVKWTHSKVSWFADWLYSWLANYGVLSWKSFFMPLCFVVLCAGMFLRPGAVKGGSHGRFTFWDSIRLSIRTFLPFDIGLKVDL